MREDFYIGLLMPSTFPIKTVEFITVVIKVVDMVDVDIGLKRSVTIPPENFEQEFLLTGDVDTGIIPPTLPPIT